MTITKYAPIAALMQTDAYKLGHIQQYALSGHVTHVYSNYTNRKSRIPGVDHVVHFGLQAYIRAHLVDAFEPFFAAGEDLVCKLYEERLAQVLGPNTIGSDHIRALHRLGYLPLRFCALPEGTLVPIRVPSFTVENTLPEFAWLTNYIETGLSAGYWQPSTSATIAHVYRQILDAAAERTGAPAEAVDWQCHDFSYRGMSSHETAAASGAGHLLSFTGTDSLVTLDWIDRYYGGEYVAGSVPATEHSVMSTGIITNSSGTREFAELVLFSKLLDLYPTGILSVVSDTFNLWNVLANILPTLKDQVMARDGKLVIRPDSGDPELILCGNPDRQAHYGEATRRGVINLLWDVFGGTINDKGFKELDPHIGAIYGDSINVDRAISITENLERQGYASTNVVFGVGSYCTHPSTLVLCDDLVWRRAGDLKVGQGIIAFDENPQFGTDGPARAYRRAVVEMNEPGVKDSVHVATERGDILVTTDHPFLVFAKNRSVENVFASGVLPDGVDRRDVPRGPGLIWKKAGDLMVGDQIAYFGDTWETDETRDGGWLAGLFDGEGSISKSSETNRISAWKVNVSQNEGLVLQKAKDLLAQRGYTWYLNDRKCQQVVLTGGWREAVRFLGSVRPDRLLDKHLSNMVADMPKLKAGSTYDLATVTRVKPYGEQAIASIRTDARTMITNGFLSHNTYQHNTRDTFGSAMKATQVEVDGRWVDLIKDPITDDGTKKSATGRLAVLKIGGELRLFEKAGGYQIANSLLKPVWEDGKFLQHQTFAEVRAVLAGTLVNA